MARESVGIPVEDEWSNILVVDKWIRKNFPDADCWG
jgi:hypothetical protein